jgi:hypothetical protein
MRIPKVETYKNDSVIEVKNLGSIPTINRYTILMTDTDKVKYIKKLEQVIRSSQEYKDYVAYLKEYIDMTRCSFFNGINNKGKGKVSIEIHHEPFTLFDLTQIVLVKWLQTDIKINAFKIAEEVMKLHYQNKVGLIPLSITVHDLVHSGRLFVPLQNVRGQFIDFLEEYDEYIPYETKDKLEIKLKMSKEIENQDLSILEKKYTYLTVDGFILPETLDEIVTKD